MGLAKQPTKDLIAALKAATPDKPALLASLEESSMLIHAKIDAMKSQANQAPVDFAISKTSQYATFLAALPDVGDPP